MHMQADAPQVSCRTPVGAAADSDLLSHDDESPPLRLDLFSDAVKPLPEAAGLGEGDVPGCGGAAPAPASGSEEGEAGEGEL